MKKSVKLALRASEIRSEINKLDPGEDTLEKRRELLANLDTVETEYRAALTEEAEADAAAPDANGLSAEERAFRDLESKAELRRAFRAVMNGDPLTGAEKELQEHRGLSGHHLPWDMIAPRAPRVAIRAEDRADAVSAAPADSHLQQHGIIGRVFARSATSTLGVAMPMVPIGEQNYPVVTTTDTAKILGKDTAEGDTADAGITAHTIAPTRLQRSYLFRREDQAVLAGLEEALRADLSGAVSDLLDAQVLAGDGTAPNFAGFLAALASGGLADRSDSPARVTFALAAGEAARGIDGKYAGGLGDCSIVIGDDTARDLASKFTTNGEESALAYMARTTRAAMASANVSDVASTFQEGILAPMGAAGMNSVCPVWDGMFAIRDEISGRKSGQISVTIGMLCGFDILRAGGYERLKFKVA